MILLDYIRYLHKDYKFIFRYIKFTLKNIMLNVYYNEKFTRKN